MLRRAAFAIGSELQRGWKAWLFAIFVLALAYWYIRWQDVPLGEDREKTTATIVAFSPVQAKLYAGQVRVEASTSDGAIGAKRVPLAQISGCRIGDAIDAERLGASLKLNPKPCR